MNRATLRTQAADFCGDKNQTRYSTTQYNTAIDRAQEQFALDTRALWRDESWTTAINDATYALPSDFQWEDWVTYDGVELKPISRHEISRLAGIDWTATTGTPTHYIVDPEEAQKQVRLYPIPQDTKTLIMRYFPIPASLSSDSSIPLNASLLMAQFHMGLAAFAAWILLLGEQMTPQIVEKRKELLRVYEDGVNKAVATFKNTASAPITIRGTRIWS